MRRRIIIIGAGLVAVSAIAAAVLYFWPPALRFVRSVVPGLAQVEPKKEKEPEEPTMPESEQPFALVRRMQVAQDAIVKGEQNALGLQDDLLREAAKSITSAPASVWRDQRNIKALAPYLLNGGPSQAVRRLLGKKIDLGPLEKPVLALLSFSERRDDAAELLEPIDPLSLPRSVGAAIALAKAIAMQADAAKTRPLLRIAQLLAPGTVIDEGALRREVSLLIAQKNKPEAVARATRYVWRFGQSIYADQLRTYLATDVLPDLVAKETAMENMQRYMGEIPTADRRKLLLDMARDSVMAARFDSLSFLGEPAHEVAKSVPEAENRMAMYEAIAKALSKESNGSADGLIGVDRSLLSPADLGLLDATLMLVTRMREPPTAPNADFDAANAASPIILAAQDAVARADKALLEMTQ